MCFFGTPDSVSAAHFIPPPVRLPGLHIPKHGRAEQIRRFNESFEKMVVCLRSLSVKIEIFVVRFRRERGRDGWTSTSQA